MALYAAKTGTQNFTDTWAEAYSANPTEGAFNTYTTVNTSVANTYQASTAFTPGAITIDAIAVYVYRTSLTGSVTSPDRLTGTFSLRLAQAGNLVAGTEVTVNSSELQPHSLTYDKYGYYGGEIVNKIDGGWVMIKLPAPVTLLAATAYTLDVKTSVTNQIILGYSGATTNWMHFLRKTNTANPIAGDRLFICGELDNTSTWTVNTVLHDSTDSVTTYNRLDIGNSGVWRWNVAASTNYYYKTNSDIRVGSNGTLEIGTNASPLPSTSTATIDFVSAAGAGCTLHCSRKSIVTMTGPIKTHYGYLQANTAIGATSATVSASSSSLVDPAWNNGDLVVFAAYPTDINWANHWNKTDQVTLTSNSNGSGVLGWTGGTTYAHNTNIPYVANLTRNIKIKGASIANTCAFSVNTDRINLVGVEMYFIDSLHLRTGDNRYQSKIENCVVREARNVGVSDSAAGPGIILRSARNCIIKDCVVSRAAGIYCTVSIWGGSGTDSWGPPTLIKNCISIANHQGAVYALGSNGDSYVVFDGCIATSNTQRVDFLKGRPASGVIFNNCFIGVNGSSPAFWGMNTYGDTGSSNTRYSEGEGQTIIANTTFIGNSVALERGNVVLQNCTFLKPFGGAADYFIHTALYSQQSAYTVETRIPNYVNNCTFTMLNAGQLANWFLNPTAQTTIINGGSTNSTLSATAIPMQHGSQVIFNNFSCPSWATTFLTTNDATTNSPPANPIFVYSRDSTLKFQRFNNVEGDHRTYGGQYMIFTDSTIVDSAPRSMKIYSANPSAGSWGVPIRIPLKKNQGATLSFKVKASENTAEAYAVTKVRKSFAGRTPSLLIKQNPGLGPNFNSDIELHASSDFNGLPTPSTFAPSDLGADLRLWLDCSNLSDITYDATTLAVSQWKDKSVNLNHLSQSVDEKKPKLQATYGINGVKPVSLTYSKDQRLVSLNNILNTTTAELEVFIVGIITEGAGASTYATTGELFCFNGASVMDMRVAGSQNTIMYGGLYSTNGTYNTNQTIGQINAQENIPVYLLSINHLRNSVATSQRRMLNNGTRQGSSTSNLIDAVPVNITPTSFSIGVGTESTGNSLKLSAHFDIYELIVVGRRMTDLEVDNMNKYLANKWNIALRSDTTTWKTLTYTIPAPADDVVIEANLKIRNAGITGFGQGWLNIDTFKVT